MIAIHSTTSVAIPSPQESQAGFTLIELIVSMVTLLVISGTVTAALMQITNAELTLWNRTQMHSGVRSATELLQQEVGQAGRVALPATATPSGVFRRPVPGAPTAVPELPLVPASVLTTPVLITIWRIA